ncbi:MAG: hypothetical protein Q9184_002632 [Pyrenodesmia sp. 2 TL-2023]
MDINQVDPEPFLNGDHFAEYEATISPGTVVTEVEDGDDSTAYTATTPPETVAADLPDDYDPFSGPKRSSLLVPWPGSTFIIRSVGSGHVITLLDGQVVLTQPGGHGSIYWACVETKGWLGFLNVVSGGYLGHDAKGRLCCLAKHHQGWERFCFRVRPEGGCVLLMTHYDRLWHVGVKVEQGVEKLAKIAEGGSDGIVWEFAEV